MEGSYSSGFGPPAESLSCCLPNKKVTKEEGHPTSGSARCADRLPSLRCGSGGTSRRDVPAWAAPSFVPRSASCLASPCATPALGLLNGSWVRVVCRTECSVLLCFGFFLHGRPDATKRPFQQGERNRCVRERAAWMRREDSASPLEGPWMARASRPRERRWSERTLRAAQGRMAGARPFGSFWGDCQKELAQQGETMPSANSAIGMHGTRQCGSTVDGFGHPPYEQPRPHEIHSKKPPAIRPEFFLYSRRNQNEYLAAKVT